MIEIVLRLGLALLLSLSLALLLAWGWDQSDTVQLTDSAAIGDTNGPALQRP